MTDEQRALPWLVQSHTKYGWVTIVSDETKEKADRRAAEFAAYENIQVRVIRRPGT